MKILLKMLNSLSRVETVSFEEYTLKEKLLNLIFETFQERYPDERLTYRTGQGYKVLKKRKLKSEKEQAKT